jgi:hypothetical protein
MIGRSKGRPFRMKKRQTSEKPPSTGDRKRTPDQGETIDAGRKEEAKAKTPSPPSGPDRKTGTAK